MNHLAKHIVAAAVLGLAMPVAAQAETLVVDVAGAQSFSTFGTAGNTVRTFAIGAGARITAISYAVSITAFDPSFLSEARLAFTGTDTSAAGVFLTPGFGRAVSGTESFTGDASLIDLDLDFAVGADGILRLEWFESFADGINPDAIWNSGNVTFTYTAGATPAVPEPATWAMMIAGVGAIGGFARYRRGNTKIAFG